MFTEMWAFMFIESEYMPKKFMPDFIIIPYQLMIDEKLTQTDKLLYGIIYWLSCLKGERCFASNKTLLEFCQVKLPKSIGRSLGRLEEAGYIKRTFFDKKSRHREEIIPLVTYRQLGGRATPHSGVGATPQQGGGGYPPFGGQKEEEYRKSNNIKSKNYIPASKDAEQNKQIVEIFNLFKTTINPTINFGNTTNRKAVVYLLKETGFENLVELTKFAISVQSEKYAPVITNPYQLKEKLAQLKIYSDKQNQSNKKIGQII
jgi:hypothetical protein